MLLYGTCSLKVTTTDDSFSHNLNLARFPTPDLSGIRRPNRIPITKPFSNYITHMLTEPKYSSEKLRQYYRNYKHSRNEVSAEAKAVTIGVITYYMPSH